MLERFQGDTTTWMDHDRIWWSCKDSLPETIYQPLEYHLSAFISLFLCWQSGSVFEAMFLCIINSPADLFLPNLSELYLRMPLIEAIRYA